MPISCDYETSYSKDRDIKTLGCRNYLTHPETDIYLVSLYGPGFAWVGHPKDAPWNQIANETWLSHNSHFDSLVHQELQRRGLSVPTPPAWHCTANLAAYCQSPRSLKDAGRELLGIELDKGTRDKMKGKQWAEMTPEFKEEVALYALTDAKACYVLWDKFNGRWPEHERQLSAHTVLMCQRGIGFDRESAEEGIRKLCIEIAKCERAIPWAGEEDAPITSPKQIALHCRKLGIEPPTSTDVKSDEFAAWESRYSEQVEFIRAIQKWRSANRTSAVLEAMCAREAEGTLFYELRYGGASHTLRWSGSAGLNLQNLPKKPVAGVDVRSLLVPRTGKLIVADYSQIEARVLLWLAQDEAMLKVLESCDLYEAHARRSMGYTDPRPLKEVDNDMRQFAKCQRLGLGYGMGAAKFVKTVQQWTGKQITEAQSKQMVADFRRSNPKIVSLWKQLERACNASRGGSFYCELPSGRTIEYFDVARIDGQTTGRVERGEYRKNLYGGLLCENLVQATAREIMAEAILKLERAGLPVVMHTHDECIVEAPASALPEVEHIMSQCPEWATGCPISVEAKALDRYSK